MNVSLENAKFDVHLNTDPGAVEQLAYEAIKGGTEVFLNWNATNAQNVGPILRFIK